MATLIEERQGISEASGICAYEDDDFLQWVHCAAEDNYYYQNYVKGSLQTLSGQFDLKYWPKNYEVVAAIGEFATEAVLYESNSWTEELLSSTKYSMADYLRVILKAIDDRKKHCPIEYLLPDDFRLSDNTLATIINCTLDLAPEKVLSSESIKRSRQNIREQRRKRRKGPEGFNFDQ